MTFATLRALHSLIAIAIDDIERVYHHSSPHHPFPPENRPPPLPHSTSQNPINNAIFPSLPSRSPSPSPAPSSSSSQRDSTSSDDDFHNDSSTAVTTPVSVKFSLPPQKRVRGRDRAYTLPPISTSMPPPILRQPPEPPLDFPNLDNPYVPNAPVDNFDDSGSGSTGEYAKEKVTREKLREKERQRKSEELMSHPDVMNAVNRIVAACAQLSASVQKPFLTLCDAAMGYHLPSCLRFLEASHTVEILRDAGPRGLHVKEIAKRIGQRLNDSVQQDKGDEVDPGKLSHILRLLATHHITREVRPDVFANNRISSFLDSGKRTEELFDAPETKYEGTDGAAAFIALCTDELFKASAYLTDCYLPQVSPVLPPPPLPPKDYPPGSPIVRRAQMMDLTTPKQSPSGGVSRTLVIDSPCTPKSSPAPHVLPSTPHAHPSTPLAQSHRTPTHKHTPSSSSSINQSLNPKNSRSFLRRVRSKPSGLTSLLGPAFNYSGPKRKESLPSLAISTNGNSVDAGNIVELGEGGDPLSGVGGEVPWKYPNPPSPLSSRHPSTNSLRSLQSISQPIRKPSSSSLHQNLHQQHSTPSLPAFLQHQSSQASLYSSPPAVPSLPPPPRPKRKVSQASLLQSSSSSPAPSPTSPNFPMFESQRRPSQASLLSPPSSPVFERRPSQGSLLASPLPAQSGLVTTAGYGSSGGEQGCRYGYEDATQRHGRKLSQASTSSLLLTAPPTPNRLVERGSLGAGPQMNAHTTAPSTFSTSTRSTSTNQTHTPTTSPTTVSSMSPTTPKTQIQTHITRQHAMHAPFNLAFRTSRPYFEWLEQPENAMRLKRFGKAMTGTSGWEIPGAIIDGFPWQDLAPHSVVVDVGGGIGSTSMLLANTFGHLRFVIQDRPQVAEMGLAAWQARCPEMLDAGIATFQGHDFFAPQPTLPSHLSSPPSPASASRSQLDLADGLLTEPTPTPAVFLLRVITHDWPDAYATRILLHLRKAAGPETKLLLADYILPLACVDEDDDEAEGSVTVGEARGGSSNATTAGASGGGKREVVPGIVKTLAPEGSPLLPNLGKANANAYWLDLTMRVTFNSQERTLRELTALTLTAGWKVIQVTRAEGSLFGHIVAVPVNIPPESLALLVTPEVEMLDGEGDGLTSVGHKPPPSDVCSPTMGDTFFSRVDLPSEDLIRSSGRSRFKSSKGLGFGGVGAIVANASEGLAFVGRVRGKRRERAHTLSSAAVSAPLAKGMVTTSIPAPKDEVEKEGEREGAGRHKKGWKTLVRMLSKPQLSGNENGR